jgi:aminomethyltransferase
LLYAAGVAAGRGMDVSIRELDVAPLQVQGPKSKQVVSELFGSEVRDLHYYWCAEARVDGIPVVVSRTGWTGEVGYEIYLEDPSRGDDLFERVIEAGRPHGIRAIAPSEARRIEAGIFNYGSDMRVEDTPLHVSGLERFAELDQERDFIGKGALLQLAERGVDRKLVGIEIDGEPMTDEGALNDFWRVSVEGRRAGRVTAGAWSPRLERNVGYAWVPAFAAVQGARLEIHAPRGKRTATVVGLPFVDPKKDIPKS